MASSKPKSAKQLKEHLQHKQEPFSLQIYLSERSYMFKNIHCLHSQKNLKRSSVKCDLDNVRGRLLQAKGILRSILCKFIILSGDCHEFSNWGGRQHKSTDQCAHRTTIDTQKKPKYGFYSKKRLAASDNFTYHDAEDNFLSYEHHGSALRSMFQTFTLPEFRSVEESVGDPKFSTYLRKQFVKNLDIGKTGHVRKNKSQLVRTIICQREKKILQTRKQLQYHENEGTKLSIKEVSELEEIENTMHQHFCLMEKQYAEAKKITQLLHAEISFFTSKEWRNSNEQNWEIQMEIGDAIMDDIVTETIFSFLG